MTPWLSAIIGVVVGAIVVLIVGMVRRRSNEDVAQALVNQVRDQRMDDLDRVIGQLKDSFGSLSHDALAKNNEAFLELARTALAEQTTKGDEKLEAKKKLIDATLEAINARMAEVKTAINTAEKERRESHGGLVKHIQAVTSTTATLQATTEQLRHALASPQARGQWGERMAEDVLRLAGLVEGINYTKQTQTGDGSRPDFTFLLPDGLRVNMDVKFPGSAYLEYLNATDDTTAESYKKAFIRDVRNRVKEVNRREYIDTSAGTVDYVLVFIPNEHIYGFIHSNDPALIDDALRMKVVLCSPLTLYAILAVIRHSVDTFHLQQASDDILSLLLEFRKQWDRYVETVDKVGKRLDDARKAFDELTTTRTRQLERQLDKIEQLRIQRGVSLPGEET